MQRRILVGCCITMICALLVVGLVSHTLLAGVGAPRALAVVAVVGCLQLVLVRLSFLPALAHR